MPVGVANVVASVGHECKVILRREYNEDALAKQNVSTSAIKMICDFTSAVFGALGLYERNSPLCQR